MLQELASAFPALSDAEARSLLEPREGKLRVVLDTDTYNEIDDQFAVVHALLSGDRLDVEAIYAAPFHNNRSEGPADGMRKSFEEIGRLLDRMGVADREPPRCSSIPGCPSCRFRARPSPRICSRPFPS